MPNANPLKQIVVKQKNGQPVGILAAVRMIMSLKLL